MQVELTNLPSAPPPRAFTVGDLVEIVNRNGNPIGEQAIVSVSDRGVSTACGRQWTSAGEWSDGRRTFPFPTIRLKTLDDASQAHEGSGRRVTLTSLQRHG